MAEKFHVTVRTIQRDMVCITEAGIPVYSNHGKNGGYSILPSYKMKNCDIRRDEQQMIRQALESLATSYANETLAGLIENRQTRHIRIPVSQSKYILTGK